MDPLDNPIWHALHGPHAGLAVGGTAARRYRPDVTVFGALAEPAGGWDELGRLATMPTALFTAVPLAPPAGWQVIMARRIDQMVQDAPRPAPPIEPVELNSGDVPDMLQLIGSAEPGPFRAGTIACGRYVGWRAPDGMLAAMAGERFALPGHTEVSAVCTHPAYRGRGLAPGLIQVLTQTIRARGQAPMLHVEPANTPAIAIYERLGFKWRSSLHLTVLRLQGEHDDDGDRAPHAS